MKKNTELPFIIQSVGLACVPVPTMPSSDPALARQPVTSAVITLVERPNGQREISAHMVSDARDMEFPLTWLINEALVAGAPTVITPADRTVLAIEAMSRRFWAEPNLADVCEGTNTIDPCALPGGMIEDEVALCQRLQIPTSQVSDTEVERIWSRHTPAPVRDVALGIAVARLMMWAHGASFALAQPDAFFQTLLPLRDWMIAEEKTWSSLHRAVRSRPIAQATSFASTYRTYQAARDAGDETAAWVTFEDGLFHT